MDFVRVTPRVHPEHRDALREVLAAARTAHEAATVSGGIVDRKALVERFAGQPGFPLSRALYRWISFALGPAPSHDDLSMRQQSKALNGAAATGCARSPEEVLAKELASRRVLFSTTPVDERPTGRDRKNAKRLIHALNAAGWQVVR